MSSSIATRRSSPRSSSALLIRAEAPWHRVEHGAPTGDRVPLLSALRPELGWPHWLLRLPMQWRGGATYERLPIDWQVAPFVAPAIGQPGEPWRFLVDVAMFPPAAPRSAGADGHADREVHEHGGSEDDVGGLSELSDMGDLSDAGDDEPTMNGLLLLALYLEPRALAMEGEHRGVMHDLGDAELREQVEWALDELFDLPPHRWAHGFVPSPGEHDDAADLASDGVCFALAACQYPPGILDVSPGCELDPSQAGPALASLARLHRFTRSTALGRSCSLVLFAGDLIYADASGGLADSRSGIERYARGYREFKAGPARLLPPTVARIVHGVDDHEIVDNWEPSHGRGTEANGPWFDAARQAAWDHRWEAGARVGGPETFWYDFAWRGAAFFVADARCEREARRVANWSTARMWSEVQRDAFAQWLTRSAGQPRFMMSGSLPLPRRRTTVEHPASCLRSDAWDGYPHSLHELLGEVWRQRASGLVFLSGDEHRSGWVSADITAVDGQGEAPVRIHSVHSSALYAPWPFAITAVEELAAPDVFEFDGPQGRRLRCEVSAWADHPGDGFAVLRARGGEVELWFDRAGRASDAPDAKWVSER
ncbi:hypothetical protein CDN99_27020 [Roseateles aquatilis]|uniref:PhoD-like phosphatase metallophosphatase domain-containing protein n=1 Tax=Roseateles aquatilis TaxID=431061 RepID=A0A2D0ALW0_9BURK|nr:alkaline phosphatase D family protein [Roseateles aquatilis]OWQ83144.1 hypothetical protein CDN99_27020 [Roseateles aquatilis]